MLCRLVSRKLTIEWLMLCRATQTMPHTLQQRAQSLGRTASLEGVDMPMSPTSLRMNLHVGVLHFNPSYEPFPLLEGGRVCWLAISGLVATKLPQVCCPNEAYDV